MRLLGIGSRCPPQQFLPAAHQLLMQMKGKKSEKGTSFLLHRLGPCKGREELSSRRTTQVPVGPTPYQLPGPEVSQQPGDVCGRGENRRAVGGPGGCLPPERPLTCERPQQEAEGQPQHHAGLHLPGAS